MTFRPESLLAPVTIQTWDQHDQIRMDFKDQANSTSWISLINTVFASIAVLPVFLVWFLGIITDSIEEKENHGDRVIILDENDTEELQEPEGEERHLYVIPNLRKDCNLLKYQQYCTYPGQESQPRPVVKTERKVEQDQEKNRQSNRNNSRQGQNTDKAGADKENENLVAAPFNWPANSDVIEHLRTFQNQNTALSYETKKKLEDIGILKENADVDRHISQVKIEDHAWLSGQNIPKKQVHAFWDNFQTKPRDGLHQEDSTPTHSPSPKSRKPMKKINLEKCSKLESRVKSKKYLKSVNHQNNVLRSV